MAPAVTATHLSVGAERCFLLSDAHFGPLRAQLGYAEWAPAALEAFDWSRMGGGGGKGGGHMARTPCKRLFVKDVSAGDADTLVDPGFLKAYCARVSTGKSLIVHILAFFERPNGAKCLVMNNWLPPTPGLVLSRLYDLKGTADDKTMVEDGEPVPEAHKRWFNLPWLLAEALCGPGASATPGARRRYALGKRSAFGARFALTPAQHAALLASLHEDVEALSAPGTAGGLMDYSLIVGVVAPQPGDAAAERAAVVPRGPGASHAPPLAARCGSGLRVHYVGIIDILQRWTASKKVAHGIKACCAPHPISTVPPAAYARQFAAHFDAAFTDEGAEAWPRAAAGAGGGGEGEGGGAEGAGGAGGNRGALVAGEAGASGGAAAAAAAAARAAALGGGAMTAAEGDDDDEFHDALGRLSTLSFARASGAA